MIHLLVSENQTYCNNYLNVVRIFLDHNYDYGLWINEHFLYCHLDMEQQKAYYNRQNEFEVDIDVARILLKEGKTPYTKQRIRDEKGRS